MAKKQKNIDDLLGELKEEGIYQEFLEYLSKKGKTFSPDKPTPYNIQDGIFTGSTDNKLRNYLTDLRVSNKKEYGNILAWVRRRSESDRKKRTGKISKRFFLSNKACAELTRISSANKRSEEEQIEILINAAHLDFKKEFNELRELKRQLNKKEKRIHDLMIELRANRIAIDNSLLTKYQNIEKDLFEALTNLLSAYDQMKTSNTKDSN